MPTPYIVKFVSSESKRGKTTVASKIVSLLTSRGYRVSVIKHCKSGVDLEEKDTKKYFESGAEIVVASAPGTAVVYVNQHVDLLENALNYAKTPIVVVEGFKESILGEAVLIVKGEEEIEELTAKTSNVVAVVTHSKLEKSLKIPVFTIGEESKLADYLETRLISFILNQTSLLNCQTCGYPTCRDLVSAYLRGKAEWCPVASIVEVKVNNEPITLNPFVKSIIKNTIKGMLRSLKGVPETIMEIEISFKEK